MENNEENEIKIEEKDVEVKVEGVYVHKLKKPFTWEGVTYTEFTLDLDGLKGSDLEAVEDEMDMEKKFAMIPEYSISYIMKLAARAAKVHSSVMENLPIRDANIIKNITKNFLLRKE
ncbi:MAG: phage tail assembly protein [Oscillospiraceae bacterium]|nr:phage tail assembly protein [Oscillospiraceae bacterium]